MQVCHMTATISDNDDSNEKGRNVKLTILRIGTKRLGPPPIEVQDKLQQIMELSKLKAMADCLLTVQRWDDLFAQ